MNRLESAQYNPSNAGPGLGAEGVFSVSGITYDGIGYIYDPIASQVYPEFYHKDHLGNVRLAFTDRNKDGKVELLGPTSEITQQNDYYPFGMRQEGDSLVFHQELGSNRYRFNGIEHNEELGLDLAPFRSYDPAIGRWMQVDPMAENHFNLTPYNHVMNNPMLYSDPMGLDTINVNRHQQATITSGGQDALFLEVSTGLNISDFLLDLGGLAAGNYTVGENGDLYQSREFSIAGVKDLIGITVGEAGTGPGEARGIASAILNQFGFDRQSGDVSLADVDGVARFATMYAKYPPDTYTDEQKAGRPYLTIQRLSNNVLFDPNNSSNWGGDRVRGALQAIQLGDHPNAIGATHWEGNSHLTTNSWHNRQIRSGNLAPTTSIPGSSVIGSSTFYRATARGSHLVYTNR